MNFNYLPGYRIHTVSKWKLTVIVFFSVFFTKVVDIKAQTGEEDKVEELADIYGGDYDYSDDFSRLSYFKKYPVNLNKAFAGELAQLRLLNEFQIAALLDHIQENGYLLDTTELQTINGFDGKTIRAIMPYITIKSPAIQLGSFRDISKKSSHQLMVRYSRVLEKQEGYSLKDTTGYLGSSDRMYIKHRSVISRNLSLGFAAEKDAGEQFFKGGQQKGFDFYSGSLFLKDIGKIKAVAVGDYRLQFGQGIAAWMGLARNKGNDVLGVKRSAWGINPYFSSNEYGFLRGVASTLRWGHVCISGFYSSKNIDGRLVQSDASKSEEDGISSIDESGYHRTYSELLKQNTVNRKIFGSNFSYTKGRLSMGATGYRLELDRPLLSSGRPYSLFYFNGKNSHVFSVDYSYSFRNVLIFGESGYSEGNSKGLAFLQGIMASLDKHVSVVMLYRHYDTGYHSFLGSSFSEGPATQNESGVYTGLKVTFPNGWSVSAYSDIYRFPFLKFNTDGPSSGNDLMLLADYSSSKLLNMYGRIRYKVTAKNRYTADHKIDQTEDTYYTNLRYHLDYTISPVLTLQNRIECVFFKYRNEKADQALPLIAIGEQGFLIYQDLEYHPVKMKVSFSARFALFDVQKFDARIYAFERSVLYDYAVESFVGRGSRFYVMAKWAVYREINCYIRYAVTVLPAERAIGSGLDKIEGNRRSDIKLQLIYTY